MCLQLAGDERAGNPYGDDEVAVPVAARIAELARGNFLVAGLVARDHGMHDQDPVNPARLAFTASVEAALSAYLERLGPVDRLPASHALTALAFAEAPGLPLVLWREAIKALYGVTLARAHLQEFARSTGANFLVEAGDDSGPVFRLFHQALNDALLADRVQISARTSDERDVAAAFVAYGRAYHWENVPPYLLRSLPDLAGAGGIIDTLLRDDGYLLHADVRRLLLSAAGRATPGARNRVRLLSLTPEAADRGPGERAALFSVTDAVEKLGTRLAARPGVPYRARWARAESQDAAMVLEGHHDSVTGVCAVTVAGRQRLASAGSDGTVRIWDSAKWLSRMTIPSAATP